MTGPLHFSPVGAAEAKDIHRLQERLFPPELREGLTEITEILESTESHLVCNLSFGLYDDTRMVGYVFAYVESTSLFHDREEEVVYIKEVALLPGYERMLRRLFEKLFLQWSAFTPRIALEAHVLADSLRNWRRMVRVFRHYGLTLSTRAGRHEEGKPQYQLLRMDVDAATSELAEQALPLTQDARALGDTISVSVVTEPRQWLTLKSEWGDLLSTTADSNVFQSFDYLWLWWKFFGIWNDLRIVVIKRGDNVIGVVPLMTEYLAIYGKTVRKLMFISAPMEMSRPKLIFGRNDETCIPAFIAYLEERENEWDIIDIDEQLPGTRMECLKTEFKARNYLVAESETLCPYIEIDSGWQEFLAGRSKKMRSNIKRLRRRLSGLGEVEVECVKRWPQLDRAMDQYCDIESRSWKIGQSLSIASDKTHYHFYVGLARTFGQHGSFELRTLHCAGEAIASTFGIRTDGVFQSLKIAHDRGYDKFSPGTVLESHELEDLFASDLECYEFMGSFLTNKLRWTSTVYRTNNIHVYQRRPRLMIFYFVYFVFKRHVKKTLKRMGQFEKVERLLRRFPNNSFLR